MNNKTLEQWLDCDDEMKMNSFIETIEDEVALRTFSLLNGKSIDAMLVDSRSKNAIVVAEKYINGEVREQELEYAYYEAESACDEIEGAHVSEDDPTRSEETIEHAALVALWVAYPDGLTGESSLESAQSSALHTAFYCLQIFGPGVLSEQVERFREVGIVR